jgi:ADP-heptose:LPS heptosyltransferase
MALDASLLWDSASQRPFEKIAVFRGLLLGDLLCSIPALRALRKSLPNASISLIGLPWAREFVDVYSEYIDEFIEFPGFPGLPDRSLGLSQIPKFLEQMQSRKFDLVLQMHGSGVISNPLIALFGARFTAGYFLPGNYCPDADRFIPYLSGTHEVWRHLELIQKLGGDIAGEELEFFLSERDFKSLEKIVSLPEKFVCLHPGAKADFRCWPVEKFAAVGDFLAQSGFQIILTGTESEKPLVEKVLSQMRNPAIDLAGRTDLRTLAALIKKSQLLICNDTGVSHLAVALHHPSVVVFTRSEFLGWPPLNRNLHRVVSRLEGVGVLDVINEAMDLISLHHRKNMVWNGTRKDMFKHGTFKNTDLAHPW